LIYKLDTIILNYSLSNVNLWLIAKIMYNFTKTKLKCESYFH
jgi:hypothetical protein